MVVSIEVQISEDEPFHEDASDTIGRKSYLVEPGETMFV